MFQLANPIFALLLVLLSLSAEAATFSQDGRLQKGFVLELGQESYFARKEFLYGEEHYTNLSARYKNYDFESTWFHGVDVGAMTSLTVKDYRGIHLSEMYIGYRQTEIDVVPTETILGQKLFPWSKLDADWGLGMWQPMKRWDFLHPEQMGLTGLFLNWQGQYGSFVLFGSGVYQPEQGAFFKIRNQRLTSSSPWFSEPADYAVITGAAPSAEILYTLHLPDITEIIFRASAGGLLTIGQLEDGFWAKVGYAYKPRNRLHLPFTAGVLTEVNVNIYPRIEYHHIGSFDLGYSSRGGESGELTTAAVSLLHEDPVPSTVETTVNRQILESLTMVSPSFEARMNNFIFPMFALRMSYLKQVQGGMRAEGPLVTGSSDPESFFGYRTDFTNAFSLGASAGFIKAAEAKLEASVRWIEEFDQHASLLMLGLRYDPSKVLGFMVTGEFLGSRSADDDNGGLLSKFRGNDRLIGGIAYAF